MVYTRDDIVKLAKHIETHDPKNRLLKELKPHIEAKQELHSRLQLLKADQKVIARLTKVFSTITLPADNNTFLQLQSLYRLCERDYHLVLDRYPNLSGLNQVFRWWLHLLPDNLHEHCGETVKYDDNGMQTHSLRVRIAARAAKDEMTEDFWLVLRRYKQRSGLPTAFGLRDGENHVSSRELQSAPGLVKAVIAKEVIVLDE
jgi:hypothetical protein